MDNDTNRQVPHDDQQESAPNDTDLGDRGASDNVRGKLNQAGGKVQEGIGKLTGDKDVEREGQARQVKGNVQDTAGNVERKVDDALDSLDVSSDDRS